MGLFGWLRRNTPKVGGEAISDALVHEATDYVVRMSDPRIALLARYRERLAPAVECTLDFIRQYRSTLGQPVLSSTEAWHSTPLLRAIFATPDEMPRVFSRSTEMVEWLARNPACNEVIATLGMVIQQQKVLGMAMQGEVLQHDVVQTTLSFSGHRARIFSDSIEKLWHGIARRILDELAFITLSRFEAEQDRRKELEEELALLRARLRAFERRGTGIEHLAAGAENKRTVEERKLMHQLETNERRLAQMSANTDLLELRLGMLSETLLRPADFVHITPQTHYVDSMNHIVEPGGLDAHPIQYVTVKVERTPVLERALVVLRIPRALIPCEPDGLRLDDAARLLG